MKQLIFILLFIFIAGCAEEEGAEYPQVQCDFYNDIDYWFEYHEGEIIEVVSSDDTSVIHTEINPD